MLKELTVEAIDRIDADYWGKCVDHMMKELEYYMVLDGLTAPIADEITPPNTFTEELIEEIIESSEELPIEEVLSEEVSIEEVSTEEVLPPAPKRRKMDSQIKELIVEQCTKELISPEKLSTIHPCNADTVRRYVKCSGQSLPTKYVSTVDSKPKPTTSKTEVKY